MRVARGLLGVAKAAESLNDVGLGIGLARIDDVVDGLGAAEAGVVCLSGFGGDPALAVGIAEERTVGEVASEETEFLEVVGDVLANVGDGAVGADDDLGIFVRALAGG